MLLQVSVALLVVFFSRVLWKRSKYDVHKIPSPPGFPLLGNVLDVLGAEGESELTRVFRRWFQQTENNGLLKANLAGMVVVVLKDPETVRYILTSRSAPVCKSEANTLVRMVGDAKRAGALLITHKNTPLVRTVRRSYATAFQTQNLKLAFPKVQAVIDSLVQRVEEARKKGPIEFQRLGVATAMDVVGQVALDVNLGGLDGSCKVLDLIVESGHMIISEMFEPLKSLYYLLFPFSKSARHKRMVFRELGVFWNSLAEDVVNRAPPADGREVLWHLLRQNRVPQTGKLVDFRALRCELASVVVTGTDTTGHQLAWILAVVASHPHVTAKLVEELREKGLFGAGARHLVHEDLAELTYLTAVVKEGLRFCTVGGILSLRSADEDMELLGYRLPKGTQFIVPSNRATDDEATWGDPHVFRPERWLSGDDVTQNLVFGFSCGPRDCPGQKLALMEMRMILVRLVQEYELKLTVPFEDLMSNCSNGLVIEATKGIWIDVRPRTFA